MAAVNMPMKTGDDFKAAYNWNANTIYNYLDNAVNAHPIQPDILKIHANVIVWARNRRISTKDSPAILHYMARYIAGQGPLELSPALITWTDAENRAKQIQIVEVLSAVGFILTSTSPIKATLDGLPPHGLNYCLPLLSMYARWCLTLCDDAGPWGGPRPCPPPTSVAVSYIYRNNKLEKIALGACTAGAPYIRNRSGTYRYRKNKIMTDVWPDSATTPAPLNDGVTSFMDWGHCAETYPFYMLATANTDTKPWVYGKAMRIVPDDGGNGIQGMSSYDSAEAQACCKGPCPNCQEVVKSLGGTDKNYLGDYWGVT